MATVDQYRSQGSLTVTRAAPQLSPSQGAAAVSEGMHKTAEAVETFADVMGRVVDFQETTQAHNISNEKMKDIQLRAAADPDPKGYQRYVDEIDKIGNETSATISRGEARAKFQAEHANTASQVKYTVQKNFWEKQLKAAHADTMKFVEDKKAEYWANPVDALKKQSLAEINSKIDELQASQAIDAEQAMKWKMDVQRDLPYGQAIQDATLDPNRTSALLEQGYYDIQDPDKKATAIRFAKARAKEQETQGKQFQSDLQDKTETNLFLRMQKSLTGAQDAQPVTPLDIENAYKAGQLSDEGTRRLILQLNKPVVQTGDAQTYIGYLDEVYSPNMKAGTHARELRQRIMEDPNLTAKQKSHLIEGNMIAIEGGGKANLSLLAAQPDAGQGGFMKGVQDAGKFLAKMTPAYHILKAVFHKPEHLSEAMEALQDQVISGAISPEQAQDTARAIAAGQALKINPNISSAKKGGQMMVDRFGNKAMVYPDGNYEIMDQTMADDLSPDAEQDEQEGME